MDDRLRFLRAVRSGLASRLGASDRWTTLEGLLRFFRVHDMGRPDSWISWVNAGVLEAVALGIAIAQDPAIADGRANAGSHAWADYLTRLSRGELATATLHNQAWSRAEEISTDAGIALAEDLQGLSPTPAEQRFLTLAQFYTWAIRNRSALRSLLGALSAIDARAHTLTDFLDWFIDAGDADAAQAGCEIYWQLAQASAPTDITGALQLLDQALSGLSTLRQIHGPR
ncbi:hypothetical protein [Actinomadura fulvescens]